MLSSGIPHLDEREAPASRPSARSFDITRTDRRWQTGTFPEPAPSACFATAAQIGHWHSCARPAGHPHRCGDARRCSAHGRAPTVSESATATAARRAPVILREDESTLQLERGPPPDALVRSGCDNLPHALSGSDLSWLPKQGGALCPAAAGDETPPYGGSRQAITALSGPDPSWLPKRVSLPDFKAGSLRTRRLPQGSTV